MGRLNYNVTLPKQNFMTYGKCKSIIREFEASGKPYAEFVYAEGEYASASSAQSALICAKKRLNSSVKITSSGGRVFLVKGDNDGK